MTAISQKYNTYLQGMSDQPDEIIKPGQLKDSVNTFPDVTFGLLKRPSLGFIDNLDTPDIVGCWGSYYRVSNRTRSEYIIQVLRDGRIRVFDAPTGVRQTVNIGGSINNDDEVVGGDDSDTATLDYAIHQANKDIQFTTILDTTVINNRTVKPKMDDAADDMNHTPPNYYAFASITQLAYGQSYIIEVKHGDNDPFKASENTPVSGSNRTSIDAILGEPDGEDLLGKLVAMTNEDVGQRYTKY